MLKICRILTVLIGLVEDQGGYQGHQEGCVVVDIQVVAAIKESEVY